MTDRGLKGDIKQKTDKGREKGKRLKKRNIGRKREKGRD